MFMLFNVEIQNYFGEVISEVSLTRNKNRFRGFKTINSNFTIGICLKEFYYLK